MSKVGIYIRLSEEDKNKKNKSQDSESIKNQKSMLVKYAIEKKWEIYSIYSDDDYSGGTDQRPGFQKLIADARKLKFNIVLCKSQSRFTRNIASVEKYIHSLFPKLGITFISIVDSADSGVKKNRKSRQINALVNEWYIEELSENVKITMDHQRRQGKYVSPFTSYGYKKSPDNKHNIIIDEEAAKIVRLIYDMYLKGHGYHSIAKYLNSNGILSPTAYKQRHGSKYHNGNQKDKKIWTVSTIASILKKQVYCGDMVQGCREKINYKTKKTVAKPKEDWIIVKDTHAPIISRQVYQQVQDKLLLNTKKSSKDQNIFAGKLFCGTCQHALKLASQNNRRYYRCDRYYIDTSSCKGCHIKYEQLEEAISQNLKQVFQQYYNEGMLLKAVKEMLLKNFKNNTLTKELLRFKLDNLMQEKKSLYLDKLYGLISAEEYVLRAKHLEKEMEEIKEGTNYPVNNNDLEELKVNIAKIINDYKIKTLTKSMIVTMIDKIEVYREDNQAYIKIKWLF